MLRQPSAVKDLTDVPKFKEFSNSLFDDRELTQLKSRVLKGNRSPQYLRYLNSFIGMVPYMGPIFVICFATRYGIKSLDVNSHDVYIVGKPKTRAIFLGFKLG